MHKANDKNYKRKKNGYFGNDNSDGQDSTRSAQRGIDL